MTGDRYVQSVIDFVPPGLPLREQIAMDLRSHIAERLQEGRPLDEVLQQLGDPLTLAESYLAAVPLPSRHRGPAPGRQGHRRDAGLRPRRGDRGRGLHAAARPRGLLRADRSRPSAASSPSSSIR